MLQRVAIFIATISAFVFVVLVTVAFAANGDNKRRYQYYSPFNPYEHGRNLSDSIRDHTSNGF